MIYLELGYGKGISDGIGASIKKAIQDIVICYPGVPIYNVEDLLRINLGNMVPSIVLMQHTTGQINQVKTLKPSDLTPASDTTKTHEVNRTPCGTLSLRLLPSQSHSKNFCVLRTNKATDLRAKQKSIFFWA